MTEDQELERTVSWFKKRVPIDPVYISHLKFVLKDYANKIHEIRNENLSRSTTKNP